MEKIIIVIAAIAVIAVISLIKKLKKLGIHIPSGDEIEKKKAGNFGEAVSRDIISGVLRPGDIFMNNVKVTYKDQRTELDNVVINHYGVFIIEVKNYVGHLKGNEDDFEWVKTKRTESGRFYTEKVKNPIRQTRRQVFILSHYLKECNSRVWVDGYVMMLNNNSPVNNKMVLKSQKEIDRVIHRKSRNYIDDRTARGIFELLK